MPRSQRWGEARRFCQDSGRRDVARGRRDPRPPIAPTRFGLHGGQFRAQRLPSRAKLVTLSSQRHPLAALTPEAEILTESVKGQAAPSGQVDTRVRTFGLGAANGLGG